MIEPYIQKRTCNGICKKFQVKKPVGEGRYGSGQGHCQTCDTWIDHIGCHMKDGSPATKESVGWFCNCCNFRVRQNPRNKLYKEKLRESKTQNEELRNSTSDDFDDVVTAEDLFISRGQAILLKKITPLMPNIDEIKSFSEIREKIPEQLQYEIRDNWGTLENFLSLSTNYQQLNQISIIILFEKLKDRMGQVPSMDEFLNKVNLDKNLINSEFKSWEHFLDLLQYDPWYRTKKPLESEINEIKSEKKIKQIPKKTMNYEEQFTESQKLMDEILSDKKKLQDIFLMLNEKLKQINPYIIRKFSREL
jgi:hypothetical protein